MSRVKNKMKAAVLHKPGDIRIEEIDLPKIKYNEVLIEIKSVGICGSDIHYFKYGRIGNFIVKEPIILGHEAAGEIVEVGTKVKNWKISDRVAIEPGLPCRKCQFCKSGHYNLCSDMAFMATPPINGAFTEYIAYPADFIYKLPENLSYEEGALIEPLSVGVYAAKKGGSMPGKTVAVLGMGTIGLATLQSVKAFGASTVIVSDIEDLRLKYAKKLGADHTINASKMDVVGEIKKIYKNGIDIVIETAGAISTCQQSIYLTKRGGTIVLVGNPAKDKIDLDIISIVSNELDIKGIFRYVNMYPTSIDLAASKKVDLKSMISKKFKLDDIMLAMKYADENKSQSIKTVISF